MPSLSLADAVSEIVAGAVNVAPAPGAVSETDGGRLAPPAVRKLETGPAAVRLAIVFETIFQ